MDIKCSKNNDYKIVTILFGLIIFSCLIVALCVRFRSGVFMGFASLTITILTVLLFLFGLVARINIWLKCICIATSFFYLLYTSITMFYFFTE